MARQDLSLLDDMAKYGNGPLKPMPSLNPHSADQMRPQMTAGHQQPAPEGMSQDAIGGIGAGVQGAGQAFSAIMQAVARANAIANTAKNSDLDRQTERGIIEGRIKGGGQDFDADMRVKGLASLLRMVAQNQDMRSAATRLGQDATNTATGSSGSRRK
jgi:hypothetical protein